MLSDGTRFGPSQLAPAFVGPGVDDSPPTLVTPGRVPAPPPPAPPLERAPVGRGRGGEAGDGAAPFGAPAVAEGEPGARSAGALAGRGGPPESFASPSAGGAHDDFLRSWERHAGAFSAAHCQVVSARAGLSGPPSTLAQVGAELGVTRPRAQQMEYAALRRLRTRRAWFDGLERRLELACPVGESVALAELEVDPFWKGIASRPEALRYLLGQVLACGHHCFEFAGRFYVARHPGADVEAAWGRLHDALSALAYPVDLGVVEALVEVGTRGLGRGLGGAFRELVRGELHVAAGEGDAPRSTAFGSSRAQTLIALLRASPRPLRVADLHARFGPGAMPDEVLFLGWGVVGLEHHVPDFRAWTDRVVPAAVALMRADDPGRQWSTAELIRALRGRVELPAWLDHWHLASMLRVSGAVRYLGRLRVALEAGGEGQRRLFIRDALEQVLCEAGQPLPHAELARRARARAAMSPLAVNVTLRLAPFVRLEGGRWGLAYRDRGARAGETMAPPTLRSHEG